MVVVLVLIGMATGLGVLVSVYRGLPSLPLASAYMIARFGLRLFDERCRSRLVISVVSVGL